jgi:Secretion system C-terminal sorting domain
LCISQNISTQAHLDEVLSRSITAQWLTFTFKEPGSIGRDIYEQTIKRIAESDAKFLGRIAGPWGSESIVNNHWYFGSGATSVVKRVIDDLNYQYQIRNQSLPICQAGIYEYLTNDVNNVPIPLYVWQKFNSSLFIQRNFSFDKMRFDDGFRHTFWGNPTQAVPDISKTETKMWFYYLATKYIESGIKSLHFGQIDLMDDNDPGYVQTWDLFSKIREFALSKNTFILLDAHTGVDRYYSLEVRNLANQYLQIFRKSKYLDLSNHLGVDLNDRFQFPANRSNIQLLFDFHSYPIRPQETNKSNGNLNCRINPNYGIYGKSKGGKSPFLGTYSKVPYIVEVDNWSENCGTLNEISNEEWCVWGTDELIWFLKQNQQYRDYFEKYAYCAVNKIDGNGYLQFLGIKGDFNAFTTNNTSIKFKGIWDQKKSIPNPVIVQSINPNSCEYTFSTLEPSNCFESEQWGGVGQYFVPQQSGYYEVSCTISKNGVSYTTTKQFFVNLSTDCSNGNPYLLLKRNSNKTKNQDIDIYPNPTNGELYLTLKEESSVIDVTISNTNGQIVFNKVYSETVGELNISNLPKGVYIVSVKTNESKFSKKVVLF